MNKKNMEQLKVAIARDLVQGQGEHSPTRELLKQYVPLEGIITTPVSDAAPRYHPAPAENTMAPHATVAPHALSDAPHATVAPDATVAGGATVALYAMVKGELRVPNTINFSLFPSLDPFAKAVYYQLFLLSHGFRRDTCIVGSLKLAKSVVMSKRKLQETIVYLETRGLIKRLRSILGGPSKGNVYLVFLPATDAAPGATVACDATVAGDATVAPGATVACSATVAQSANNKNNDDIKIKSSSKGQKIGIGAALRGGKETADDDLSLVRAAYEKATGNRWNKSDSEAYHQNAIGNVPIAKTISALEAVAQRTPAKINSFKYFVKEIIAQPDPRNRAWQKKRLEKIVHRIRDNSVGCSSYYMADFVEDVKCTCAREGVQFDNDIFNELVG
jgi:hypothetical protein